MSEEIAKVEKPWYKKWYGILGIVVFGLIILGNIGGKTTPAPTETTEIASGSNVADEADSAKSYQQVFTFSGNGAKKSEPFTISGSRFKIKYDCTGDYCGAFVYEVGSAFPQAIMNSTGSTKDETIIYGSGEYYIDANTMGSFSMTVEDYR